MKFAGYALASIAVMLSVFFHLIGVEMNTILIIALPILMVGVVLLGISDYASVVALSFALMPFADAVPMPKFIFVTPSPYSLAMLVLFLVGIIGLLSGKLKLNINGSLVCLTLFAFIIVLHAIALDNPFEYGRLIFEGLVVPYFSFVVALLYGFKRDTAIKILRYYAFSGALFSLTCILSAFMLGGRARPFGIPFISSSTYILPAFMLALYCKDFFPKKLRPFIIGLTFIGLITTMPRVYILFIMALPMIKLFSSKKRLAVLFLIVHIVSLIGTLSLFEYARENRLTQKDLHHIGALDNTIERITDLDYLRSSIVGRFNEFEFAMKDFKERPLVGIGMVTGVTLIAPHNYHVVLLQYSGLIGYFIFSCFFIFYFFKMQPHFNNYSAITACSLSALAIITNGITNSLMHGSMPIVLYFLMGLTLGYVASVSKEPEQGTLVHYPQNSDETIEISNENDSTTEEKKKKIRLSELGNLERHS